MCKDPIGMYALIAPWNSPTNLMVTKLAPALPAGCSVVMKPASPPPLSSRIIVDAITAAGVPAGVVNLVTGPGRTGDLMVHHPKVSKVAFTGSTQLAATSPSHAVNSYAQSPLNSAGNPVPS